MASGFCEELLAGGHRGLIFSFTSAACNLHIGVFIAQPNIKSLEQFFKKKFIVDVQLGSKHASAVRKMCLQYSIQDSSTRFKFRAIRTTIMFIMC